MDYFAEESPESIIDAKRASALLEAMLEQMPPLKRVLLLPPDLTRLHSWAGELTVMLWKQLQARHCHVEIMPALGTHLSMTAPEIEIMFPGIPHDAFRIHDWKADLVNLGEVPGAFVETLSEGRVNYPINCEINRLLVEGRWDRIISIGQLVPHEVIGIANHNKNVFVGTGGQDTINKTHFLGAVFGMERIMGRPQSPVRDVLNYMEDHFARNLPVTYLLTVREQITTPESASQLVTRGLYAGESRELYQRGADLARRINLQMLERPIRKAVVYLDPGEFKSTWLGNKAIYRTRMAIADGGELIILAPGVRQCGEDPEIDRLIRKYGYRGTPYTLDKVRQNPELAASLSAAAHLIHGSSEGRFTVTYCTGGLTRENVEGFGFNYGPLEAMLDRYDPAKLRDGWNMLEGEEAFYVSNPALGLWALKSHFE